MAVNMSMADMAILAAKRKLYLCFTILKTNTATINTPSTIINGFVNLDNYLWSFRFQNS